jgi:hypothetical protein
LKKLAKNVLTIVLITVFLLVTLAVVDPIVGQEPDKTSTSRISKETDNQTTINRSTIVIPDETPEPEPTGIDDDEFGKTITQGSLTPSPEPKGIEHEDIGIAPPDPTLMPEPAGIDDDDFGIAEPEKEVNVPGWDPEKKEIVVGPAGEEIDEISPDSIWIDIGYPRATGYDARGRLVATVGETKYVCTNDVCACFGDEDCDIMITSGACDDKETSCEEDTCTCSSADTNENDLDFVRRAIGVKAVFPKMDDVKGDDVSEATPGGGGTNEIVMDDSPGSERTVSRYTYDIKGRVTETKSDGEVVIKGSKIKENSAEFDKNHKDWIEILSVSQIETQDELEAFAVATMYNDTRMEEVSINFQKITMKYNQPAKLFGLFDIDYTYHAEVDELGRVKVKTPWWLFLTKNNAGEISSDLERQFESTGDDAQLANTDLQSALQKQKQTLQTLSSVMKAQHDTAMAVNRKIG